MKLEFLLQFIVPLTFLAIWALTSLLNRDAQPLPPRPGTGRGPGAVPPRVGAGGGFSPSTRSELTRSAPLARPASPLPDRSAPARWSSATVPGRPSSGPTRAVDEGIVIIESESRASQGSSSFSPSAAASGARTSRGTGPASRKAAGRSRPTPAPARPVEPERRKTLTGLVGQSLSQKRSRPLEIVPLSTPMTPISSGPLTSTSLTPAPEVARTAAQADDPSLSIDDLRAMLTSPKRLREIALLGELLQPPVSLRAPRRPR